MKPLLVLLARFLFLFALVVASLVFIFTNFIGYREVLYIFGGLGLGFAVASVAEAEVIAASVKGAKTYAYFTPAFISKRFIKIVFFLCAGCILLFPPHLIRYFSFLCFLVAGTEIVVTLWRSLRGLCFVAFEADRFLIATNKLQTVYATQVASIEKRHGITYLVYGHRQAITLRTDQMRPEVRKAFDAGLSAWIGENRLEDKVVPSS